MPRGNPSPKLAITVHPDVHAGVVGAAAEGVSVSAWMTEAARGALRVREGLAAVGEWEADRNERAVWADHKVRLEAGVVPAVPAPVVAQVSRSPSQVQLRRLLRGCEVVALTEAMAHAAGQLLGRAQSAGVADAVVVQVAAGLRADLVTRDRGDITRLIEAAAVSCQIIDV
jgi:predicted nucleic acid-binding protein